MSRGRFSRGGVATAPRLIRPYRPFSHEELDRFLPLARYWERRERRSLNGASDLDHGLCVQIADACEFVADGSRLWLPYAYVDRVADWRNKDVNELDALFEQVRADTGFEPEDAVRLARRASDVQLRWHWRGGSPTIAAGLADTAKGAWTANHRRGRPEQQLTTWVWLTTAYFDVPWDAAACTWCDEPYPLTSAMAHVAGRVVGREVARDDLGHIYGKAGVGGCTFGLQLIANAHACGLFGDDSCEGCPLIEGCYSFNGKRFPYEQ